MFWSTFPCWAWSISFEASLSRLCCLYPTGDIYGDGITVPEPLRTGFLYAELSALMTCSITFRVLAFMLNPIADRSDISSNNTQCKTGGLLYSMWYSYTYDDKSLEYPKTDKHVKAAIIRNVRCPPSKLKPYLWICQQSKPRVLVAILCSQNLKSYK